MSDKQTYILGMFPYPSGRAHMGHVRVYTISDTAARHARRKGASVLHPIGWDAFGLPAENAAIREGVSPEAWTKKNIETLRATFRAMGWSFDWDTSEIDTSSPSYYRFTQQIFLWMYARSLAYLSEGIVPYCPRCATALADEQVEEGCCWRCHSEVEAREIPQWMLRITAYADRLWEDLSLLTGWDRRAVAIQRRWIGRTEGQRAVLRASSHEIAIFVPGHDPVEARAILIAPEHPIALHHPDPDLRASVQRALSRSRVARASEGPSLLRAAGISTEEGLPVFVSDAVLPERGAMAAPSMGEPWMGPLPDPVRLPTQAAVAWNLRDWSVGRQRRWGCPIPMVRCDRCGIVPVAASELPVLVDAPIDRPCPRCEGPALRERDTLDTFVCSAWYAMRFTDPRCGSEPFRREEVDRYMPIDLYVGGLDHAAQHMLYFRFVTKVLFDMERIGCREPVTRFVCNGLVRNEDGQKMSKSGRSVSPDDLLARYPSDALKLAVLADVPVEHDIPWEDTKVAHKARFLRRLGQHIDTFLGKPPSQEAHDVASIARVRALLSEMDSEIERSSLHTAVAKLHAIDAAMRPILSGPRSSEAQALVFEVLAAASDLAPQWASERALPPDGRV